MMGLSDAEAGQPLSSSGVTGGLVRRHWTCWWCRPSTLGSLVSLTARWVVVIGRGGGQGCRR